MEVQEVIVIDGVALADLGELFWQVPGDQTDAGGDQQLHLERFCRLDHDATARRTGEAVAAGRVGRTDPNSDIRTGEFNITAIGARSSNGSHGCKYPFNGKIEARRA